MREVSENVDFKDLTREKSKKLREEEAELLNEKLTILDKEQKAGFELIKKNSLTLILGSYGTGKTMLMTAYAAYGLKNNILKKVYISRPLFSVKDEQLGSLPGEIKDKMTPYCLPMLQNFEKFFTKSELEYNLSHGKIEMLPTMFFRGINIGKGELLLLDETQNLSREAMKKTVTRIAQGGKIILAGDRRQMDLKSEIDCGLLDLIKFEDPDFSIIELSICHRANIVDNLCKFYDNL